VTGKEMKRVGDRFGENAATELGRRDGKARGADDPRTAIGNSEIGGL